MNFDPLEVRCRKEQVTMTCTSMFIFFFVLGFIGSFERWEEIEINVQEQNTQFIGPINVPSLHNTNRTAP